ncbi:helix-turn-helix transcriptional regulator [Piscinibacter sp.]|uniref:helix-turn-helix transcriptional regulator n=1 Tax=Piscinibacter sp. TaxID=1903157 RepID=UPI002C65E3DF|nr:LuxR C-terminal-related transcriptional regulator [Albitalea sp.]HUG22985.1 LuxR C-terminal-related transcriptional regulator [Albitalea sp.]
MVELTFPALPNALAHGQTATYTGRDRRAATQTPWHWLAATLDEIDYGMVVLTDDAHALHINHAARAELDAAHPLQLLGRQLRARHPKDVARLHDALSAAQRGLRKLMTLGEAMQRVSISVVPLCAMGVDGRGATLLMLGKRRMCEALSVQGYARSHGLTPAEARVLAGLCEGHSPSEIAAELGVAISTIRTQIGSIRQKTDTESIRDLVQQVAVLPPLMGVLGRAPQAIPLEVA